MARIGNENGSIDEARSGEQRDMRAGPLGRSIEDVLERLRDDPDGQGTYVMALAARVRANCLPRMSPDAKQVTFYIDAATQDFTHWLATKTHKSRDVQTEEGYYHVTQEYPTLEYLLSLRPAVRVLVQEVLLDAYHMPPLESRPPGGIAFVSNHIRRDRIEVRAVCSVSEILPIFNELLQLIGAAYPESGLAALQTNRAGRPKSAGHTAEQLQLIKRIGELRAQGLSHAQIARDGRVQLSRSRVSQICRENGFEKGVEGN